MHLWRKQKFIRDKINVVRKNLQLSTFHKLKRIFQRRHRSNILNYKFTRWRKCLKKKLDEKSMLKADIHRRNSLKDGQRHIFHYWMLLSNNRRGKMSAVSKLAELDLNKNAFKHWRDKYSLIQEKESAVVDSYKNGLIKHLINYWLTSLIRKRNHRSNMALIHYKSRKRNY